MSSVFLLIGILTLLYFVYTKANFWLIVWVCLLLMGLLCAMTIELYSTIVPKPDLWKDLEMLYEKLKGTSQIFGSSGLCPNAVKAQDCSNSILTQIYGDYNSDTIKQMDFLGDIETNYKCSGYSTMFSLYYFSNYQQ